MATNKRTLHAHPREVFDVLANGWLYPSWVVGASRMRQVDKNWPAPGSNLHHSFGVWPVLIDDSTFVLEWDPPHRVVIKARGWPVGTARVVLDVVEAAGGCVVTIQEDAEDGPGRLIPKPIRDVAIHWRNDETLKRLAFLVEGNAE